MNRDRWEGLRTPTIYNARRATSEPVFEASTCWTLPRKRPPGYRHLFDIIHLIGSMRAPGDAWRLLRVSKTVAWAVGSRPEQLRAERGEARLDLFDPAALGELTERAAIGRDRVGFLPRELLGAPEPHQQILVVEILGTEPRQRDLERVDRLRVVALGLPRVRDAALAQGLERPGRPLSDGELPGAAGLAVLLGVEAQVAELVRHLGGAGTRRILRERGFEIANAGRARVGGRLRAQRRLRSSQRGGVGRHGVPLRDGVPVPAAGAERGDDQHRGAGAHPRPRWRQRQPGHP